MSTADPLLAFRLSLFCAALFAAIGVYSPFWPVWLKAHRLSDLHIAVLVSIPSWIRVVTSPLLASLADRSGRRRRITLVLAWVATLSFALFRLGDSFGYLLVVSCVFGAAYTALVPMSDQSILACARGGGLAYGRIRVWGSISFLALSVVAGRLVERFGPEAIFVALVVAFAITLASGHLLPPFDSAPTAAGDISIGETLRVPGFGRVLLVYGLVMGSHSAFSAFSAVHWQAAGIRSDVIGLLWAEGVLAEILLFAAGGRLLSVLGARGMLVLGALGAAVRWAGTAATTAIPALIALQALHALTFGACHLGAMEYLWRRTPARLSTTALGLLSAVSGLFGSTLMVLSGVLYERVHAGAFLMMVVPAVIGLGLAVPRLREAATTTG